MTPDKESGVSEIKQSRLDNPSGWMKLTQYETVRLLVDVLLESPPNYRFNKSELKRRSGLSREAVRNHLSTLVELGVVEEVNEGEWPEYRLNDEGKVTQELFELNSAVNSVLSGESKNIQQDTVSPDISKSVPENDGERFGSELSYPSRTGLDNSSRKSTDAKLFQNPPWSEMKTNAD